MCYWMPQLKLCRDGEQWFCCPWVETEEMRMMMMHSTELDTKPLSSLCSWLCFPPDSVLIVQKHFTSEHMFSHVTFGCVYFTWQTSLLRYWCPYSYFAFICTFVT